MGTQSRSMSVAVTAEPQWLRPGRQMGRPSQKRAVTGDGTGLPGRRIEFQVVLTDGTRPSDRFWPANAGEFELMKSNDQHQIYVRNMHTISRVLKSVPVREVPKTSNKGHSSDPRVKKDLKEEECNKLSIHRVTRQPVDGRGTGTPLTGRTRPVPRPSQYWLNGSPDGFRHIATAVNPSQDGQGRSPRIFSELLMQELILEV
ncbi:hypothetical protein B0H11DRAFT_1941889 [Mycena galericulata]|nr:hypothetical protein B0H11DRAFT_1941889 [Mycena galericulata]